MDSESALALCRRFLEHQGGSAGGGAEGGGFVVLPTARTFFPQFLLSITANGRASVYFKLKQVGRKIGQRLLFFLQGGSFLSKEDVYL